MVQHGVEWYQPGRVIKAVNRMDRGYSYRLDAPYGDLPPDFRPMSPQDILHEGVFEGKYLTDCRNEFPKEWYAGAPMVRTGNPPDISLNKYGIKARQPLKVWKENGWILGPDNRGWFQWYCRYYLGRRISDLDKKQIARWKSFKARHLGQLRYHLSKNHNVQKQKQALLQWGIDPEI